MCFKNYFALSFDRITKPICQHTSQYSIQHVCRFCGLCEMLRTIETPFLRWILLRRIVLLSKRITKLHVFAPNMARNSTSKSPRVVHRINARGVVSQTTQEKQNTNVPSIRSIKEVHIQRETKCLMSGFLVLVKLTKRARKDLSHHYPSSQHLRTSPLKQNNGLKAWGH